MGLLAQTDAATLRRPAQRLAVAGNGILDRITARVRVVAFNPKLIDEKRPAKIGDGILRPEMGKARLACAHQRRVPGTSRGNHQSARHGRSRRMADRFARFRQDLWQQHGRTQSQENGEVATRLVNTHWFAFVQREKGQLI